MKKIIFKMGTLTALLMGSTAMAQVFLDAEDGTTNKLAVLNVLANGPGESNADFVVVANPLIAGVNTSSKVVQFTRRTGGVNAQSFAGFYSFVVDPDPDFTTNKYVHVKILKTKLSPVRFKIEGGPSGNSEIQSTNTYTTAGVWQDMVFNFSASTGVFPVMDLFPDFEDPLINTGDIIIYFDDIKLNNISTPEVLSNKAFNYLSGKVRMYTNSTKTELNIETSEKLKSVNIYDVQGRKISEENKLEIGFNTINISNLNKGIYLIEFKADNGESLTNKFIKE